MGRVSSRRGGVRRPLVYTRIITLTPKLWAFPTYTVEWLDDTPIAKGQGTRVGPNMNPGVPCVSSLPSRPSPLLSDHLGTLDRFGLVPPSCNSLPLMVVPDHDEMATLSAYALLTCYPSDLLCHSFMRYDVDLEISSAPRVSCLENRLWVHICFGLGCTAYTSNLPAGLAGITEKRNLTVCSSTGEPLQVWSPSSTSLIRLQTQHESALSIYVREWPSGGKGGKFQNSGHFVRISALSAPMCMVT